GRHAVLLLDLRGKFNRGDGFQEGKQRSAKQACLLSGNDRNGVRVMQPGGRCARLDRCLTPQLLRQDDLRDGVALTLMLLGSGDCLSPGSLVAGITGKELGYFGKIERVVGNKRPDPRKPAYADRNA